MNNHQNAIFHQITNFLKTPLALLGVDLKNFQFNKICHFANHPYLCKGLLMLAKPKPAGKSLLIALTPTKEMTNSWANKTIKSCIEPTETHHSQTNKNKTTDNAHLFATLLSEPLGCSNFIMA